MPHGFIRADDVLQGRLSAKDTARLEVGHGNGKLMQGLQKLGMIGPMRTVGPWELEDPTGHRVINASGYAALPFGDNPPELNAFIREVLEHTDQVFIAQQSATTWRAALQTNLVRLLASEAPAHRDSRVFFSNSGTEAVEAAIKFAAAARPKAKYIINFKRAYHGKTLGSLALTPNAGLQLPAQALLSRNVVTLPYGDADALERALKRLRPDRVIAVISEPVLGEAGVMAPPAGFLQRLGEVCAQHGIVTIADEIQTGLGRTGHWFSSVAQGWVPDIITLAKPLGGGMVAIGATIVRDPVYKHLLGELSKVKRHSNTFGGNTLSMAVGLKSLEMLIDGNFPARSRELGERGLTRLRGIQAQHPHLLSNVRGAGMLFAMDFNAVLGPRVPRVLPGQKEFVDEVTGMLALYAFYKSGVQLNFSLNAAHTLRITPAMNMPLELFDEMFDRVEQAADEHPTGFSLVSGVGVGRLLGLAQFALLN